MATLEQWLSIANELRKANSGRDIDCSMLYQVYQGELWNLTGGPIMQDRSGRVMFSNTRQGANRNRPLVINYLKGIVDDYVALLGSLPDVKVPPPGPSQEEQQFADTVEKYHYGIWHASQMAIQMKAVAWWNSVMGNSVGIVWPDFKRKHPVFRFAAPYTLHAIPDVEEPFQLAKAIMVERYPRLSVQEMYPDAGITNPLVLATTSYGPNGISGPGLSTGPFGANSAADGLIDIIKCFDKNEVVTIINNKVVRRTRHELGFCPVVSIPNILVPGSFQRGQSDIEQVVGLAQNASWLAQSYREYVLQELYALLVVKGGDKVPEDINLTDPNTIIQVSEGGDVFRLKAGNGSAIIGQQLQQMQGLIEYNTGVPQVRMEGTMKSSITTGRGIDRAQGPYFSRTAYRTDILSHYLELMNSMAVRMQTMLWPHQDFELMGMKGRSGSAFQLKMNTDQLDNYTFNKVLYSMAMGMDPMQRMVFVKQGLQGPDKLMDRRFAIEFLGITDRPEEMLARADAETDRSAARELKLRQAAQGGAPDAAANAANLEGGGNGAPPISVPLGTPPPANVGEPHSTTTPPPGSPSAMALSKVPVSDFGLNPHSPPEAPQGQTQSGLDLPLIEQIARMVRTLPLKGSLWAIERGGKVRLTATSMADSRKVHDLLSPIYGKQFTVTVSKNVPAGARDLTAEQPTEPTEQPSRVPVLA